MDFLVNKGTQISNLVAKRMLTLSPLSEGRPWNPAFNYYVSVLKKTGDYRCVPILIQYLRESSQECFKYQTLSLLSGIIHSPLDVPQDESGVGYITPLWLKEKIPEIIERAEEWLKSFKPE